MTLNFWKIESSKPAPLLVHIHGGGWLGGKKSETAHANELKKGYSFASIDYRLAGVELLPAAVHDAARAVQFLRTKAQDWNIDPKRIAVTGGSAGAASSMWLAYHDDLANPKSDDPVLRNHRGFMEQLVWAANNWILFFSKRRLSRVHSASDDLETVGAESHEHLMKNWDQQSSLFECLFHMLPRRPPAFLN